MKSLLKINPLSSFFFLFFFAFCGNIFADNSGLAVCKVIDGNTFVTWLGEDTSTTYPTIEAAIGTVATNPTTWTITRLTGTGQYAVQAPSMATNANGDVIVVFEYYDSTTTDTLCAAAMLPTGTSTWIINVLSTGATYANMGDQRGSIDELGNVIVTWGAYDPALNENHVFVATSTISTTPTWSGPVQLSP